MQEKQIHIIFQVLNFLATTSLSISANERLMLIYLARHKGRKGIYPSLLTLAKETGVSRDSAKRTIKCLTSKNLIKSIRNPGKSNHYTLLLPELTRGVDTPTQNQLGVQTPLQGGYERPYTRGVSAPQSIHINNPMNNTERALSLSEFQPSEPHIRLAAELRLNLDDELKSFKSRHKGTGILIFEFERWLKNSYKFHLKNASNGNEVKSTVPEYGAGHPRWEMLHGGKKNEQGRYTESENTRGSISDQIQREFVSRNKVDT